MWGNQIRHLLELLLSWSVVSLFVVRCSLFVVRCSLFVVRCSLFVVRCSLFVVRCSLFVVRCSLFVAKSFETFFDLHLHLPWQRTTNNEQLSKYNGRLQTQHFANT